MKRIRKLSIGLALLLVLTGSMVCYSVQYNQTVIVTTFGRADEQSVKNRDGTGAGLHLKWPWPVQEVARVYESRVQVLDDRLEEQQTLDKQDVIVNAYLAWRITDPLPFYRTLNSAEQAERQLRDRLRDARAQIGNYTFDQLTSLDPERLKLAEAEAAIQRRLQEEVQRQGYGVRIEAVGIKQIVLAEPVTQKVFERMRANRQRLAQRARSEGDAAASDIRAKARSAEQRVLAFAERRAEAIRAEGDAAAAEQYKVFAANEEFAVFLRKLEEYKRVLKHNTTFLMDARCGPFDLFAPALLPGAAEAPATVSVPPASEAPGKTAAIRE